MDDRERFPITVTLLKRYATALVLGTGAAVLTVLGLANGTLGEDERWVMPVFFAALAVGTAIVEANALTGVARWLAAAAQGALLLAIGLAGDSTFLSTVGALFMAVFLLAAALDARRAG